MIFRNVIKKIGGEGRLPGPDLNLPITLLEVQELCVQRLCAQVRVLV